MAYTSPRQWLDLLRSKPGSRFTDLGPAGKVLDATGGFMQRNSANPGRDWRSIMAEGDQRRQQSEAYGGSAISQAGMPGSSSGSQPTARRESYTDILAKVPGSAPVPPPVPEIIDPPQDPQGFLSSVGSFFEKPGIGEMLMSSGAAMSQAASQPGASVWGSLGAGTEAGLDTYNLQKKRRLAQDELASDTQAAGQEAAGWADTIQSVGTQKGIDPALLAEYVAMASNEDGFEYAMSQIAPELLDPVTGTAPARNIASMQAARATLQGLIAAGVGEDDPEMILARQAVNDWELEMGVKQLPEAESQTTGQREWADYVVLLQDEFGADYQPTAADMMNFRTNALTAPGRTTRRSPGEVNADKLAATDAMLWESTDRAAYIKRYDQISDVIDNLQYSIDNPDSTQLTGFTQGMLQSIDGLRAFNVEAADAFDNVRSVVFESLKETLGGQFAEREGERLVAAAYNPYLPAELNIKRLKRLTDEMRMIATSRDSRARHMRNNDFSIGSWVDPYGDMIADANLVEIANTFIDASDYDLIEDRDARTAAISGDVANLSEQELSALFDAVFTTPDASYTDSERELLDLIFARY